MVGGVAAQTARQGRAVLAVARETALVPVGARVGATGTTGRGRRAGATVGETATVETHGPAGVVPRGGTVRPVVPSARRPRPAGEAAAILVGHVGVGSEDATLVAGVDVTARPVGRPVGVLGRAPVAIAGRPAHGQVAETPPIVADAVRATVGPPLVASTGRPATSREIVPGLPAEAVDTAARTTVREPAGLRRVAVTGTEGLLGRVGLGPAPVVT